MEDSTTQGGIKVKNFTVNAIAGNGDITVIANVDDYYDGIREAEKHHDKHWKENGGFGFKYQVHNNHTGQDVRVVN